MRYLKYILIAACMICATDTFSATPTWEHVAQEWSSYENEDTDKIEVYVRDGYIYIATTKPVTVKLTSIVGQLISQQTVQAGISRIKVNARGIYILKAGSLTTRVNI